MTAAPITGISDPDGSCQAALTRFVTTARWDEVCHLAAPSAAAAAWSVRAMTGNITGRGKLDGQRDRGYAPDDTRAPRLILARLEPDEFVVATGEGHLARDWYDLAFNRVGLEYRQHLTTDPARWRPAAAVPLVGRSEQANRPLGDGLGLLARGRADDGRGAGHGLIRPRRFAWQAGP